MNDMERHSVGGSDVEIWIGLGGYELGPTQVVPA